MEAETAMRAPFGQKPVAVLPAGEAAGCAGPTWAAADFAANAAALAMPSAVRTSRRELMVHPFRSGTTENGRQIKNRNLAYFLHSVICPPSSVIRPQARPIGSGLRSASSI